MSDTDPASAAPQDRPLSRATVRGAAWNYVGFVLAKGLTFISTVILARLLAPEDFGLLALGLTLTNYLDVLNDLGIGQSVIYLRDRGRKVSDVAFGVNLGVGVALTLIGVAIAPLAARFYDEPKVTGIMLVLAPTFFIASFGSIQDARMRRDLDFRRRLLGEVARTGTKGVASIALALAGFGVWSLVLGQVVGVCFGALVYWFLDDWRPRFVRDRELTRSIIGFGARVTLLGLLLVATATVDYIIVGRRLGTVALGFYSLAFRLPSLVIQQSCTIFSQAVFPAFSQVQDDPSALRRGLLRSTRAVAAITVPASVVMAVGADEIVAVLFGPTWASAAPVLGLVSIYTMLLSLTHHDHDVYKAVGRPGIFVWILLGQTILIGAGVWWAAGHDIRTVAATMVAVGAVTLCVRVAVMGRVLRIGVGELLTTLRVPLVAGVVMAGVAIGVDVGTQGVPALLRLLATGTAGAMVYAGATVALDRAWIHDMVGLIRGRAS